MTTSKQHRPLRSGTLGWRGDLVLSVSQIVSDFAPKATLQTQRSLGGHLRAACLAYVAARDNEIGPTRFRAQIKLLTKSADTLHRRLSTLSPFTRAVLQVDHDAQSADLDGLERSLGMLMAHLQKIRAEEGAKGRDYVDPPGSLLVQQLLRIFMRMKRRTKVPSVRFDGRRHVEDPDDVSHTEFGRFVMAVEAAIVAGLEKQTNKPAHRHRLRNRRAAIVGAVRAASH